MEKKRILYVDRGRPFHRHETLAAQRDRFERSSAVRSALRENFIVDFYPGLSIRTLTRLSDSQRRYERENIYSSLVTHFPYDVDFAESEELKKTKLCGKELLKRLYIRSYDLIKKIRKKYPNFPIIAYTGAGEREAEEKNNKMIEILVEAGFNEIIWKSGNPEQDGIEIRTKLLKLLNKD